MNLNKFLISLFTTISVVLGVFTVAMLLPWQKVDWGQIEFKNPETVTVTGVADSQQKNEVATFSAGVSSVNDDKQSAIDQVNNKIEEIIKALKDFGIEEKDIKTQNLNVYQMEDYIQQEGRQRVEPGQWRVNNTVEVKLRDVEKASDLTQILTDSGATNVYGPSFAIDDTGEFEYKLFEEAVADARAKAEVLAKASGKKLGDVKNVVEGTSASPVYREMMGGGMGGGGVPLEPGSSTISKSVTVTFGLK